jgi:hypothetical protein
MDGRKKVSLGDHEYVVVPQRVGYLFNGLGSDIETLFALAGDETSASSVLGKPAHGLLAKLIPGFMEEWEFMGFGSAEAYEAGTYVPDSDTSPTPAEVFEAVKAVATISLGQDGSAFVKGLVGSVTGELRTRLLALLIANLSETSLKQQPSSPQRNGASDLTSSGTPAPTDPTPAISG